MGLNFEKFKALGQSAVSAVPDTPIATIEMAWPDVAVRLAVAALQIHFSNNPRRRETTDEFLIRGALRPILVSMLSEGFVSFKEHPYVAGVKNSQRLDVLLTSFSRTDKQLAWIELKSDAASPADLRADWAKLLAAKTAERRISIFCGILDKDRFDEFESVYRDVRDGVDAAAREVVAINSQFINFESLDNDPSDPSGKTRERLYSVAYVFAVGTKNPNIAFNVFEKP